MRLIAYLLIIDDDETVIIVDGEKTLFCGTVREALLKLSGDYIRNATVVDAFVGYMGITIETET